jgi:hypothetical protein
MVITGLAVSTSTRRMCEPVTMTLSSVLVSFLFALVSAAVSWAHEEKDAIANTTASAIGRDLIDWNREEVKDERIRFDDMVESPLVID